MALRVLLADESSTIKRVIQLALQDFGVEVKSVPVGLDVLPVAKSFQPDIVFADVLLAKRSGYEVCADIKGDNDLANIPVVLMWSGFMEFDEGKARGAKVDRRLEKPFDPEQLRTMVRELVPRLQSNVISEYLSFPERPEFVEEEAPAEITLANEEVDGDAEAEEFRHVPLPKPGREIQAREQEDWSQADLQKFRITSETDLSHLDEIPLPDVDQPVDESNFAWTGDENTMTGNNPLADEPAPAVKPSTPAEEIADSRIPALDFERAEQILRQQAREIIESIAWKILPDITEKVVREELQKLLKDSERLDQL